MSKVATKDAQYRKEFKALKSYHNFSFNLPRGKLSPNQKRAITLQKNSQKDFRSLIRKDRSESETVKFIKGNRKQLKALKKLYPEQVTNKGAFIKIPRLRSQKLKSVKIKGGKVEIKIGNMRQEIIPINQERWISDREKYLDEILEGKKRPDAIGLQINGYASNVNKTPEQFIQDKEQGYFNALSEAFKNEAEKYNAESAKITGIILTYYGDKRKRKTMSKKWLEKIKQENNGDYRKL